MRFPVENAKVKRQENEDASYETNPMPGSDLNQRKHERRPNAYTPRAKLQFNDKCRMTNNERKTKDGVQSLKDLQPAFSFLSFRCPPVIVLLSFP
jgi:hypothetical protein